MSHSQTSFIHGENLLVQYASADEPALNSISFTIERGDFLGLLGPNGAGKTTTISMLTTLLKPKSGTLTYDGKAVYPKSEKIRNSIGVVPQDIALYQTLTLRENIEYFGKLHGVKGHHLAERTDHCLEMVGLHEYADKVVSTFSGGMKRRANLAVGIIHAPDILFLDEPTVGVDVQSRRMILENLRSLNSNGMTVVYTTHYMEEVQQLCSRILMIDKGTIILQGEIDDLMAIHSDCKNLDDLFLKLTGTELRDG